MKKILYFLLILIVFMLGLTLGDTSYTKNQIIDNAMNKFEEEIQKEDNEYENIMLKPNSNIFNKVAYKIDELIDLVVNKVKEKM